MLKHMRRHEIRCIWACCAIALSAIIATPSSAVAEGPPEPETAPPEAPAVPAEAPGAPAAGQPTEGQGAEPGAASEGEAKRAGEEEPGTGSAPGEEPPAPPTPPAPTGAPGPPPPVDYGPAPSPDEAAAAAAPAAEPRADELVLEGEPEDDDEPFVSSIDVAGHLGLGVRLDDPPLLDLTQRVGLLFGLGADVYFTSHLAVGLYYEHLDLGDEELDRGDGGLLRLTRDLNSIWARLRAYPWRGDDLGLYVSIGVAPVWQSVDATGVTLVHDQLTTAQSFQCEGADTIDVALRAGVGLDVPLAAGLRLLSSVGIDSYRLGEDLLDGCAPGAGTSAVFGLRTGLAYGFPLD